MSKEVEYNTYEDKNYQRYFANNTFISQANGNRIDIDFYQEYVDSVEMIKQEHAKEQLLHICRVKQASASLGKEEAIQLAKSILDLFTEEEKERGEWIESYS